MLAEGNPLKAALAAGRLQKGLWLSLGSEVVAEIAGAAGYDWCLVDGEHAPWDPVGLRRQLQALAATGTPAILRVPTDADWILKQALDLDARSIMVPMVSSVEQAEAVVRACRYPPQGIRGNGGTTMRAGGFGARPGYAAAAAAETSVIVQVETRAGLDAVAGIAAVEGVDCVFFGPADLAADMGYRDDPDAAPLWQAIAEGIAAVRAAGAAAGVFGPPHRDADMIAAGVTLLAMGADAGLLTRALRARARA